MRYQGRIAEWNGERGFGFIARNGDGERFFVHVTAFPRSVAFEVGTVVNFELSRDSRGRQQAIRVERERALSNKKTERSSPLGTGFRYATSGLFLTTVAAFCVTGKLSWLLFLGYSIFSLISFLAYGWDKVLASRNQWRISEKSLHVIDFLGGWPGGFVGQGHFRHKWQKSSFVAVFRISVVFNIAALGLMLVSGGTGLNFL